MKRITSLAIAFAILFLFNLTLMAQTGKDITVTVADVPAKTGKVLVAIENREYYGMADAAASMVKVRLKNIPNGKYKLNVFHDANGNWILDRENNVPSEYCATQDIEVNDSTQSIFIKLVNVKEMIKPNNE